MTNELPSQPYTQSVAAFPTLVQDDSSYTFQCLSKFINYCSSFPKMKRLVAYWIRYMHNLRNPTNRKIGPLTADELEKSLIPLVKCVQASVYAEEIRKCHQNQTVKSNIKFLSPFIDAQGVLRVGGRLQQSLLGFEQQHPILLPKNHPRPNSHEQFLIGHFTRTVARHYHQVNLHAGPQLLLSLIRQQFWVPRGQNLCTTIVRRCVKCHRQDPNPLQQIMAPLPSPRVVPDFPFVKVGIDYAGPFKLAVTPGRNPKIIKAYVCICVCMVTKAIHLEFASDLSTPTFIAAFERFIAIRNVPSDVYSDGGTNFRGAKNDMDDLYALINNPNHQNKVEQYFAGEKVDYHFNPPLGPHHGGLWERAVRSMKYHLARVIEGHHLSIEEFLTLLAKTAAALNSRPLTPMSTNPDDFETLTPFHFLTLRPPKVIPQEDFTNTKQNRLSRWQLVQQMHQHLFRRWSTQYLQSLQQKQKWLEPNPNVSPGDLVLVHDVDGSLGPQNWILGRIESVFPGPDGKVRTCDVRLPTPSTPYPDPKRTQFKILRRPITRLSPLPIEEEVVSTYNSLLKLKI